jgi:hypothetical protein
LDCDAGATKTFILKAHRQNASDPAWAQCFGMRPSQELYNLNEDPDCLHNLSEAATSAQKRQSLQAELTKELTAQGDPRMLGQGDVFDHYEHASKAHVGFYEKFMNGEKIPTAWANLSDYEPAPLEPAK